MVTFNLVSSAVATGLCLFHLPSSVVSQFSPNGGGNALKVMEAVTAFNEFQEVRLRKKAEALTDRANHVMVSREKFENKQIQVARGSLQFGDGEVIVANAGAGVQAIDPRTPKGFGDPFFRQINVEQKVELDSIMSDFETTQIRKKNDGSLKIDIASGWKYLDGKGTLKENKKHRTSFMALLAVAPNKIIYRRCDSCERSHQDIYYKRKNKSLDGVTADLFTMMMGGKYGFHASDCGTGTRTCEIFNQCGADFTLHSTYEEAIEGSNPWQSCDTRDFGKGKDMWTTTDKIGFPGHSGPSYPSEDQHNAVQQDWAFFVEDTPWFPVISAHLLDTGTNTEKPALEIAPAKLKESPHMIIRRVCPLCTDERYRDVYYRRIFRVPNNIDIFTILGREFHDQKGNEDGLDYGVYSTYADAINAENPWYCGDEEATTLAPTPVSVTNNNAYQAETYSSASKIDIKTKNKGYTGEGYVDYDGAGGYVEWSNIDGGLGGDCSIKFRYAVGGYHKERPCQVSINGVVASGAKQGILPFEKNDSWTLWTYDTLETSCLPGIQTIRLTCAEKRGPNIDSFVVIPANAPPPIPIAPTTISSIDNDDYDTLIIIGDNGDFPLGQCQGDCDNDNDCQEGLDCMQRRGGDAVPGCLGNDSSNKDYCYGRPHDKYLWISGDNGEPKSAFPLGQCEGDCDNNDDCEEGLNCMQRSGGEAVPGCVGDLSENRDYCIGSSLSEWSMTYRSGGGENQDPALWKTGSEYIKQNGIWDDPTFYIRRICRDCAETHQDIIYKRRTVVPSDMDVQDLFLANWRNKDNIMGVDFQLYSSFEDAENDSNEWQFCNYNDSGIGFPRDCAPVSGIGGQWSSLTRSGGQTDISYYVWNKNPTIGSFIDEDEGGPTTRNLASGGSVTQTGRSTKWRIWTDTRTIWDVKDLVFYSEKDCTGTEFIHGTPISSGYGQNGNYGPENVFDAKESSIWGGRKDDSGDLWVGMDFSQSVKVRCMSFFDAPNNGAPSIRLQAWDSNTRTWRTIKKISHRVGVRQNVPLKFSSDPEEECSRRSDQTDYRGILSRTSSGRTCQRWGAQNPHGHDRTPRNYPSKGLAGNYCRNPDGESRVWCYTTSSSSRWEFCSVPTCNDSEPTVAAAKEGAEIALSKTSKQWRIWADADKSTSTNTPMWDVKDLAFYSTADCTGNEFTTGTPISSGYSRGGSYGPENAFDDDEISMWGGRPENGAFYLGMDFNGRTRVRCISFLDRDIKGVTGEFSIQAWETSTKTWQTVKTSNHTAGDRETAPLEYTQEEQNQIDEGEEIGFPGRCRPHISDPLDTFQGQWIKTGQNEPWRTSGKGITDYAFYIEGKSVPETGEWMSENDEMEAYLNPGAALDHDVDRTCKESAVSTDTESVADKFPPNLTPYSYRSRPLNDPYAGYYDIQRCGQCNDYCSWVGPSGDGSGLDPEWKAYTQNDHFACKLAGGYNGAYGVTERDYFGNSFPYQKCRREGANTPGSRKEKYIGCFHDKANDRALPLRIGKASAVLTIDDCADACRAKGYHYFSRQEKGYCYCGGQTAENHKYAKHGEIDPLSSAYTCSSCDGSNIGYLKQCVFQILDQYDPAVERKKNECSHIPSINVRRHCYVSCRDQNKNYKNLLACQTLKVKGLRHLNTEIASWRDSPICDTKNCIKESHPLGGDISQDSGIH